METVNVATGEVPDRIGIYRNDGAEGVIEAVHLDAEQAREVYRQLAVHPFLLVEGQHDDD